MQYEQANEEPDNELDKKPEKMVCPAKACFLLLVSNLPIKFLVNGCGGDLKQNLVVVEVCKDSKQNQPHQHEDKADEAAATLPVDWLPFSEDPEE